MNGQGNLVLDEVEKEKAEMFSVFFASIFTNRISSQIMCTTDSKGSGGDNQPGVGGEQVRENLKKMDVFKSAGPDTMHPRIVK